MTRTPHLVLIVAAAGFGKSTALEAACPRGGEIRSARAALDDGLPSGPWVGVDDVHELSPAQQVRLTTAISALPITTSVVLTSRRPLAPEARGALRGRVSERGPQDLALGPYAVHRVLAGEYGVTDPELPVEVHALTAGWPALVHFAADALARNADVDLLEALAGEGAPAAYWLQEEVLARVPEDQRRALAGVARLGAVTRAACGDPADLVETGLLTELHAIGLEGRIQPVPVVAEVLSTLEPDPTEAELRAVAATMESAGLPFGAARACVRVGDWPAALRLVAERGDEMLCRGEAAGVVDLIEFAPGDVVPAGVRGVLADALWLCGDLPGATRALAPLVAEAGAGEWQPALAARVAAVHYSSGRFEEALDALDRSARHAPDASTVDRAATRVHALCSLGRTDDAAAVAADALALADATGDPRALTSGHLAMARVSSGERKGAHHEQALRAATEVGDVVVAARILVNHSFQLLATARFDDAGRVARDALRAADVGVATGRRAAALHNLAEALMYLGEYDEAAWHLKRAVALCRRLGIGRTALGLLGLAEIDRQQGRDDLARARYQEAVELARGTGEAQVLVPALAGLARVLAFRHDEPSGLDRARAAADEAVALASGGVRPFALTAAGWVALCAGDRAQASELARQSVTAAREIEAFDLLADALELGAACSEHPDEARQLLAEALAIWQAGGAQPPTLRIELQLGRLPGADATARSRARDAARQLQRFGVRNVNGQPVSAASAAVPVRVEVLGGFRVSVDDVEVPGNAWRSRQARTLVKILAGRRGRPVTRAWLCETLWPDDDPAKTGHRLSVLLATVRGVLDPDRRWATDRFIAADLTGVWLDLRHVALDAETLIRDAEVAASLMDDGEIARAGEILADINARYRGDAFEDEPGEEWADGLREEVRAAWQRSVRRLAALARRAGRVGDAQTLLVRLLVADPYDEKVHELLVKSLLGAGRRGEAGRAFERWRAAMRDIGAPDPDPAFLGLRPVVTPY